MSAACNGTQQPHVKHRANRNEIARRRWKILARALQKSNEADGCLGNVDDIISVRRFTTFNLITSQPMKIRTADHAASWFEYSANVSQQTYSLLICHPTRSFTATELIGFNNTGNICVWPSEEVLAYYILNHLEDFSGKTVLELGGGMTCLAGLMVAKYSKALSVHLTDGNASAVENVKSILEQNVFGETEHATCSVLQWGDIQKLSAGRKPAVYDVILSADCLFFDDSRQDLVETMWTMLNEDGIAFVMAPRRGKTFDKFIDEAKLRGFHCKSKQNYNEHIWNRHLKLKQNCDYDENIHYPMLLLLAKSYSKTLLENY